MFPLLKLNRTISSYHETDLDDVTITKRSLNRLGYYSLPDYGLTPYTDTPMLAAVRRFQRDHRLEPDGIMMPDGPTVRRLSSVLEANKPPPRPGFLFSRASEDSDSPTPEECDDLFWNVDVPTCKAILARRGKRASARYAACLHGRPISELPPLDTWNQ